MTHKIEWLEEKTTSTGKKKYDASLSIDGKIIENVTIWDTFPDFANLKPGSEINCDVVTKQNGQYTNITAYPTKTYTGGKGGFGGPAKTKQIEEAQLRKAESIAQAQDRSAWMWAKNNATELLKGRDWTMEEFQALATDIYNLEPNKPF